MSRKPKPPVKKSLATVAASDVQERTALVHLEKGRYRDAVACFKALLRSERRPQWIAGLADAYSGRAQGLADKGMLKEAIELWRSRAELCATPLWDGPYVGWLIADGRVADVLGHLAARRAASTAPDGQRDDEQLTALEARLAPALLATDPATTVRLPAESLLLQHRPLALAALAAYSSKDAAALETALAGISFRSPYRDLRTLLKAMVLCETDQDAARAAIERIPLDSPFESLAAPLRTLLVAGPERLQRWARLNSAQQTMALDLMGCPQAVAPLLQSLAAQAGTSAVLAPHALFDLVLRHARELPNALARQAWQWLAPWAERRGCASPRLFGNPTAADQECATALAVELKGEWDHAETHWFDATNLVEDNGCPDDHLRAALILRHVALSSAHLSSDGVLDEDAVDMLTRSLALDPLDCSVHVRLVQYWRNNGNLKNARDQLDAGLSHFPDDVALLTEAVEIALASGAFKKAAAAARRLLELDPLNRKVRARVGNAHLSHAVKQIGADKLDAAKKEISEAANWLTSATDQGRMYLLQAWTEPAGRAERSRLAKLAVTTWGGGLAAGWRLLHEGQGTFPHVGLTTSVLLLGEAGIDTSKALTHADLLELTQVMEQEPPILKGLDPLLPWRKAIAKMAAAQALDADACVRLCEAFRRHKEHDLAEKFANAGRKRWPDRLIFVYHAVAARFGKNGRIKSDQDFNDLDKALERAHQSNDTRLAARIELLFELDDPNPDFGKLDFPGDQASPFVLPNLNPAVLRNVLEESIKYDGGKAFLNNARRDLGDALVRQVEQECAGDRKAFLRRIIDLIVAEITDGFSAPAPTAPAKIVKPQTPVQGQGNLFDE
ncbi:hypothetical protein [Propionivibrio sp.]|uniref:hypothetical protein n=1 Tax=Propionivibrio sp. TaxID=2212460 RepID=UPI003BF32DE2